MKQLLVLLLLLIQSVYADEINKMATIDSDSTMNTFSNSYTGFYDGLWKVTDVVGESWFSLKERHIGKTQEFWKGYAGGVFFTCNYKGLVTNSEQYTFDEFLNTKEFKVFKKHRDELSLKDMGLTVTRKTCTGNFFANNKEMYPIITFEDGDKALYLNDGAVFVMEL